MSQSQTTPEQDFQPLPTYKETTTQNNSWVAVTLTRTDSSGSVSQVQVIAAKR
jgi:hypothetical protein